MVASLHFLLLQLLSLLSMGLPHVASRRPLLAAKDDATTRRKEGIFTLRYVYTQGIGPAVDSPSDDSAKKWTNLRI